jgi:hypothetical protein
VPTVVQDRGFTFIIHTRELPFEPPHVHVLFGGDEVRIELAGGTFMEEPPPGATRMIRSAYARHASAIWVAWERIHGPIVEGGRD